MNYDISISALDTRIMTYLNICRSVLKEAGLSKKVSIHISSFGYGWFCCSLSWHVAVLLFEPTGPAGSARRSIGV